MAYIPEVCGLMIAVKEWSQWRYANQCANQCAGQSSMAMIPVYALHAELSAQGCLLNPESGLRAG